MERPRPTGGRSATGARNSLGSDGTPLPRPTPAVQRLCRDPRLHAALRRIHECGPRSVGMAIAELCDHAGVEPQALDYLLTWCRLDPVTVRAVGGADFPRPPMDQVPEAA